MLRSIPLKTLREWRAYSDLEPFGEERMDLRFASVVAAVVNMNRNTKKHPKPFPLSDFVLPFGEEAAEVAKAKKVSAAPKDWRWMKAIAQAMTASSQEAARSEGA